MALLGDYTGPELEHIFELLEVPHNTAAAALDGPFGTLSLSGTLTNSTAKDVVEAIITDANHTAAQVVQVQAILAQYALVRFDAFRMEAGGAGTAKGIHASGEADRDRLRTALRTYIPVWVKPVGGGPDGPITMARA